MNRTKRNNHKPLKDYYAILGVARNADIEEIRQAFRKLAQDMHPDRNPSADAKERFQELGEAYQVLKSPDKRKAFDARVIAEYCESMVGMVDQETAPKRSQTPEFLRILRKGREVAE